VRGVVAFFEFVGEIALLLGDVLRRLLRPKFEFAETLNQMSFVGVSSVPIVALTSFFSGAVFSLYVSKFLYQYGAVQFVGATIGLAMARELGPVLAGIMVAARCGSSMAAQIGSMAVTEQIDALKMLSVNPTSYLVIPRTVASALMLPILGLIAIWSGIVGGLLVAVSLNIPSTVYIESIRQFGTPDDFLKGIAKTPFFGIIVALVACQQGLRTKDGAVGVGRATTNTVVIAMVLVYVANYLLASILF